jgi:hypothetical protein
MQRRPDKLHKKPRLLDFVWASGVLSARGELDNGQEVLQEVSTNGTGAHQMASNVGAAGVALASAQPGLLASGLPYIEVLDVLFASSSLFEYAPTGTSFLGTV